MKNKKSLVAIFALVLVLLIGATIAYYTSSASFDNEFHAGKYKIVTAEVFQSPDNWKPGEEIPKTIITRNEGTVPAAVRVSFTEKWEDSEGNDITSQVDEGDVIINFDNQDDWIKQGNYYYYKSSLDPDNRTSSIIKSVTLNSDMNGVSCTASQDGKGQRCTSSSNVSKYTLTITKETVQYDAYKEIWGNSVPNIDKIDYVYAEYGDGENEDGLITRISEGRSTRPTDYNNYLRYKVVNNQLSDYDVCTYNGYYGELCLNKTDDFSVKAQKVRDYFRMDEENWNISEENGTLTALMPNTTNYCRFVDSIYYDSSCNVYNKYGKVNIQFSSDSIIFSDNDNDISCSDRNCYIIQYSE